MAHERWQEQLEAWLDGELDPESSARFEAETESDPELRAERDARIRFRDRARAALRNEVSFGLGLEHAPLVTRRPRRPRWPVFAAAAVLAVAILIPALLRNQDGAEGPRSTLDLAGNVAAPRFGETPNGTVVLEAGCFDLAAGSCR
jgi:anti-sigma factor RsiW